MENRAINMHENWIKLDVPKSEKSEFIVTSVIHDLKGTKITLDDEKNVVELFWNGQTPILRSSDEGIRLRTSGEVQRKYNDKTFFRNCYLYRVENSKLLDWAVEESCGLYEKEKLNHYCVVTSVYLVDVIAGFEPEIVVKPL